VGHTSGRHLVFLHGLKERGLGLRGRPVDLVRQQHIRKNGAFQESKRPLLAAHLLLEHIGSRDVGRHEVGSELNPVEMKLHDAGQG